MGNLQQESSSSSGIFKLLDPASSSASVGGGLNIKAAAAAAGNSGATSEQDSRKRNLNYRFHFLESDEDDLLSAGSSVAERSGGDENTHSGAGGKFGRYREEQKFSKYN